MIKNRIDYLKYIEADRIALGRKNFGFKLKLKNLSYPDYIWNFQRILRKTEYCRNTKDNNSFKKILCFFEN